MDDKPGSWKRPETVPFPSIWSRFSGRKEINGVVPNFWIQDIPEEEFETVVALMASRFLVDEPGCKYLGLINDLQSVEDFCGIWRSLLPDRVGLICYMENPDGKPLIAGINCTFVKWKNRKLNEPIGATMAILMETVDHLAKMKDEFEFLKCDVVLQALGLYVVPEFRGQGVGFELLKTREPLCKAMGLKGTVTIFSSKAAHVLAERVGFKDLSAISFEDLEKANPRLRYPGIQADTTHMKYMYKEF